MTNLSSTNTRDFNEQEGRVIIARSRLYIQEAWFGGLISHLGYRLVDDPQMPTCCTNGKVIYFNINFIKKCTIAQITFIIGHELLHCLLNHFMRKTKDRNALIWNMACDYVVNAVLIHNNIGKPPKGILYDSKYYGMTSEEIYKVLEKKTEEALEKLGALLDIHPDQDQEEQDGEGDSAPGDKRKDSDNQGGKPSPSISKEVGEAWNDLFEEGMSTTEGKESNVAGSLKKTFSEVLARKKGQYDCTVDWKQELHEFIKNKFDSDLTYMRPLKKTQSSGIMMPSIRRDERLVVAIALDTSGSMEPIWLEKFLQEIQSILSSYDSFYIHLWCFDTSIHNYQELDSGEVGSIEDYRIEGGGGTDFQVNWDHLEEHGITPDMLIVLTDGHPGGTWGDEGAVDSLFAIIGEDNRNVVAPFGKTIFVEIEN